MKIVLRDYKKRLTRDPRKAKIFRLYINGRLIVKGNFPRVGMTPRAKENYIVKRYLKFLDQKERKAVKKIRKKFPDKKPKKKVKKPKVRYVTKVVESQQLEQVLTIRKMFVEFVEPFVFESEGDFEAQKMDLYNLCLPYAMRFWKKYRDKSTNRYIFSFITGKYISDKQQYYLDEAKRKRYKRRPKITYSFGFQTIRAVIRSERGVKGLLFDGVFSQMQYEELFDVPLDVRENDGTVGLGLLDKLELNINQYITRMASGGFEILGFAAEVVL